MNEGPFLSPEEVERLPEGTHVRVTWSGGNGPHAYVIAVDERSQRYAARNDDPDDPFRWYNPITYVGTGPVRTRVSLIDP